MIYLNLPKLPTPDFQFPKEFDLTEITKSNVHRKFSPTCLDSPTVDFFAKLGLTVETVAVFSKEPNYNGAIHKDITWSDQTQTWEDWYCGVNFNLDGGQSIVSWYEVTTPAVFPPFPRNGPLKLDGAHYGGRHNKNFKGLEGYTLLATHNTGSTPVLVRTDVPHSVENATGTLRLGASIRFLNNPTFEQCASLFSSISDTDNTP